MALTSNIKDKDWVSVRQATARLASNKLGPTSSPKFGSVDTGSLTVTGLTTYSLVYPVSGLLTSLGVATNGQIPIGSTGAAPVLGTITGTADEIDVTNAAGSITIGLVNPLIVGKGGTGAATLTDHGILLGSGTSAVTPLGVASNGYLPIGSAGADPVLAGLTGTANRIFVTNGAGSITLTTPQDIHTGANPTFANLNLTGYIDFTEIADPGASAAGVVRLFNTSEGVGEHLINLDEHDHWHDLSAAAIGTSSHIHDPITVTDAGGLNITWSAGSVFDAYATDMKDSMTAIAAQGANQAQTAVSMNFLYYDQSATGLAQSVSEDDIDFGDGDFPVFACATNASDIFFTDHFPIGDKELHNVKHVLWHAFETLVTEGLIVSEHAAVGAFDVDSTAGHFIHLGSDVHDVSAIDSTVTNIVRWFHDASNNWTTDTNSQIDAANWDDIDDSAGVIGNNAAKYYRSTFYIDETTIHWVYPQVEYNTLNQALIASDPIPPDALFHFPKSTTVILRGNAASFPAAGGDQWIDVRPIIGQVGTAGGTITDHGNLAGLLDDDHTQYLLADGTRALAGTWDMGSQIITNLNADTGDINIAVVNTEWDTAFTHVSADGSSHSAVALNTAHRLSDGKNHSDVVLNNTHRSSTGADHSYLDQAVTIAGIPQFAKMGIGVVPDQGLVIKDEKFAWRGAGVNHGFGFFANADVFCEMRINAAGTGGLDLRAVVDSDAGLPFLISALSNVTLTVGPYITFQAIKNVGGGAFGSIGATEIAFQVRNNNTPVFSVDGDGDTRMGAGKVLIADATGVLTSSNGVNFTGAITNLTVVNGIVTAAS